MNKIDKFLRKLQLNERKEVLPTLISINKGKLDGLSIKKLQGQQNFYRVRVGRIRIIFFMLDKLIVIKDVSFRDDTTYNKY